MRAAFDRRQNYFFEFHEGNFGECFSDQQRIFFTLAELFVRPGNSIQEFLDGKRKRHFKPIAYVLTWSTVYFVVTQIADQNTWVEDVITGWMNGATGEKSAAEIPRTVTWFSKNYAYATLLLLPVFSLASYLAFLKFGRNYLEHIVLNSYITGQQAIFYALFAIAGTVIESDAKEMLPFLVAVLYTFWVFWQFFPEGNRVMIILRSAMTYALYLVFSTVLLAGLMGIGGG